jgi:molybdopterin synthase sulfur carrier subunit
MIKLLYFARLREALGRSEEGIELRPGLHTVAELRAWLCERGEPWTSELAAGRGVLAAVNQTTANDSTPVNDGDEVAFFPPVTGG